MVDTGNDSCYVTSLQDGKQSNLTPVLEKHQALLLMMFGFGGLSVVLGLIHRWIRKHVYRDSHNLDTTFDAGGRVTVGLTAVTVTSHLLWPADFLQSATVMSKTGLAGSLFFVMGTVLAILIFPLISITLKTRAPGAKTFLQIIYARFGKPAHIMFCCIAIVVNLMTTMSLILAAKASIVVLAKDVSDEMILLVLAFLFGSYCLIGGLGTTFYIAYFNTALTFVCVLVFVVNISQSDETNAITMENMFEAMNCIKGPDGNYKNSFLTFRSRGGIFYGFLVALMAIAISLCDQANWQSRIAAKPSQGVVGFLIAGYLWFAIPLTITMTASSAYMAMSYQNGSHLLSSTDVDSGLDITDCTLCGKTKIEPSTGKCYDTCQCPSVVSCQACDKDIKRSLKGNTFLYTYECNIHGRYRQYEDKLLQYKNWCMLWVILSIVPYGLIVVNSNVNLNWSVYCLQGVLSAFIFPLFLTILWPKCTGKGVIAGCLLGAIAYFTALLIVAEMAYDDGLRNFITNTSSEYSLLGGMICSLTVSSFLTICVSLYTNDITTGSKSEEVWDRTLLIDNPLNPWRSTYEEELRQFHITEDLSIKTSHMSRIFRKAKLFTFLGGSVSLFIFVVIIPASVLAIDIMSFQQFVTWFTVCKVWVMVAAVFAIIAPPVEEIFQVVKFYRKRYHVSLLNGFDDKNIKNIDMN